jgi:ubiquinone/menaquinone biosynthesis C-methylase UbiE
VRRDFLALFERDRRNVEEGLYPQPVDLGPAALRRLTDGARRFFADLPNVDRRRLDANGVEVREKVQRADLPTYYLQNFHYQTDGWLSDDSAAVYDTQVEVLFAGAADAMRRLALGALVRAHRKPGHARDQRKTAHLDLACGTGRFLAQTLEALPRLSRAVGVDLSEPYCAKARTQVGGWRNAEIIEGAAEHMPFDDGAFQSATCVYLFHELPPKVRREVARELARVIATDGVLVLADSLQTGDAPHLDQFLEYFPVGFHEPYYGSWMTTDIKTLFGEVGFTVEATERAYLTKVVTLRRA